MRPDQRFWTILHGFIVPVFICVIISYLVLVVLVHVIIWVLKRHHETTVSANETRTEF